MLNSTKKYRRSYTNSPLYRGSEQFGNNAPEWIEKAKMTLPGLRLRGFEKKKEIMRLNRKTKRKIGEVKGRFKNKFIKTVFGENKDKGKLVGFAAFIKYEAGKDTPEQPIQEIDPPTFEYADGKTTLKSYVVEKENWFEKR